MLTVRLEASKKGVAKPYLAEMLIDGKRRWAEKSKISNTRKGFWLDVEVGAVIDGRGSVWSGNGTDYTGGYFCALVTSQGAITIDRTIAEYILERKKDGWIATGMWAVDDGEHAVRIGNDNPLGDTPKPGQGDCGGVIFEKDGKIDLVEDYDIHDDNYEGRRFHIAPVEGGFARCDLASRLNQLKVFIKE